MKRSSNVGRWLACLAGIGVGVCAARAQDIVVPGLIKFEAYTNILTTTVDALTSDASYPASPGEVLYLTSFDTRTGYPTDVHENYGGRITGYVTPTQSGDYEFFIRSDDAGQLFVSTDDSEAKLALVAEETGCCDAFHESGDAETSAPIAMVAGKRYLVRALFKEGGGGDFCQVAWRKVGDTTPAATLLPIPGAFLSVAVKSGGTLAILRQPAAQSVAHNSTATFSLGATNSASPLVVQWQRNGVAVPGQIGTSYTFGPVKPADNGAKFRAVVSMPGATVTSDEVVLTVTADATPPRITTVSGSDTFDTVTVDFSEEVTAATAAVSGNYSLDGGLTVSAAALVTPTRVRLTTSKQTLGATYVLSVKNVADTAGLPVAAGTSKAFGAFAYINGGLKMEAYFDIAGSGVQALLDATDKYPDKPDLKGFTTQFTSRLVFTDSSHENYGGRLSGWIIPPATAEYEFFIRSDDSSVLQLSPDDKPENAVTIAEETGCCGAFEEPGAPETSVPVRLEASKRYYIQAIWKEGGGGDYCDVAWRKAGDTAVPRALPYIPGTVLQSLAAPGVFTPPTVAISSPAAGSNFEPGAPVVLTATVGTDPSKIVAKVEFYELTRKLGEVAEAPYTFTVTGLADDVHIFSARVVDSAGLSTDSAPVSLTVGSLRQKITLLAIDDKTTWRYDRSGRDLSAVAREKNYDDSAWPQGKALIADETTTTVAPIRTPITRFNDEGTYVKTFYFRSHFDLPSDPGPAIKLALRHAVDDGAVFYLNGHEVHRFGIAQGVEVDATTDAAGHENVFEGPFDIPTTYLVKGDNVLMAEVHQSGGSSSDMVFGAELEATIPLKIVSKDLAKIDDATEWRYDRSGRDLGTDWRQPAYNDSTWPKGKALIADETTTTVAPIRTPITRFNDEGTYVKTFYFRTHFALTSTNGAKLKLRHAVDDGAVFYLNGVEVHRFGIGADVVVDSTTDAAGHENVFEGPFEIAATALQVGDNVLAVEVHQSGGSSSDMVFGAELTATTLEFDPIGAAVEPAAFTKVGLVGGGLTLEWTGSGKLESAPGIGGPWTEVTPAVSPLTIPASQGQQYYRFR